LSLLLYIVVGCDVLVLREEHIFGNEQLSKVTNGRRGSEGLSDLYPYSNISGLNQKDHDGMDMQFRWVKQEKCKEF
jgi:hypothetical protein